MSQPALEANAKIFNSLRNEICILDPVAFAETYLTVDGRPFNMTGNGWRPMTELYREVAAQATSKTAKPMVILKGRQIGATVLAAVLSLYFTASGLYGNGPNKPPMRVLHAFPTLGVMGMYAKDKLRPMIMDSRDNYIARRSLRNDKRHGRDAPDDTITEKTFIGFNKLRVDSVGVDSSRLRGMSQDAIFFDECFPHDQHVETEFGKKRIGILYKMWRSGKELPRVKSYNETTGAFEYKKILHAWERGLRELIQITCSNREIRCTPNHLFLTEQGWKTAASLQPGDFLKTSPGTQQRIRSLNDDQFQIVLGSFLGDGHLDSHKAGRYRLSMTHGIAQKEYCEWKASMFDGKVNYIEKNGYAQTPAVRFCSRSFGLATLPQTKASCPQWVLDKLDARGLAIWFMDDGSAHPDKIAACISTCSFDEDSQKRIVARLKLFGIDCRYAVYDGYYSIYLKKSGYLRMMQLIEPYVHRNHFYKIPRVSDRTSSYKWNVSHPNYGLACIDKIVKTATKEVVYDIEVEDNHNFILAPRSSSPNLGGPIVHNCQAMSKVAIENALRILTSAQYGPQTQGIQLYFGTPLNAGSHFWYMWEDSDQRFFQPRCLKCGEYFFLYTIGNDEWKQIWIKGYEIECPSCQHRQDKRLAVEGGRWQPTKDSSQCKYVGYHINLILSPIYTKEAVLDYDPSVNKNRSERAWRNETLGEFYSSGGVPLSREEISFDTTRGLASSIAQMSDKVYTMGVDWGDKIENDDETSTDTRGQSYTAVVITSVNRQGVFTIENAFRLPRNDFTYKIEVLQELFRRFKIRNAAADVMWGQDVVGHMQDALGYGDKFLGCINSGSLATMLSYKPKETRVIVNKDLMLEHVFTMFRNGKIVFPAKGDTYDKISWLVEHCCSMEVRTAQRYGSTYKKYVKGLTQNDGLQALMYSIIAHKFLSTGGFKNSQDKGESRAPLPTLAYMPGKM